jgi:hypothetical protein
MTLARRIITTAAVTSLATLALVAPNAQASSARISVGLGEAPQAVAATYPSVDVPSDTDLMNVTLPAGFDWTPANLADPAPDVTWSVEKAGAIVGSTDDPPAPDSGVFAGFGTTGSIDFSNLPADPPVGAGYTLHLHAVWSQFATLDANDVVDLRVPFDVTDTAGGGDVAFDMTFDNATTESRTFAATIEDPINGGDILQITTTGAETAWDWTTGPDPDHAWATRALVVGGLGIGSVDPTDPTQTLSGPFSVSTPEPETLLVALPDVVYSGATKVALKVTSKTAPLAGPVVTTYVNVTTSFATGTPRIVMTAKPVLSGTPLFGRTLSVSKGSWTTSAVGSWGSGPLVTSYQWFRGSAAIVGATGATHPIVVADIGKSVSVRVATRFLGYTSAGYSVVAGVVSAAAAPRLVKAPYVAGTLSVGHKVAVRAGTWSPVPTSYRYQWRKDGVAIKGATASTYALPTAMRGHYLTCTVVTVKSGYKSGVATTAKVLIR